MNIFDRFIQSKRADGRAPRTIEDYQRVLGRYAEHVTGDETTWTRDTARAYVAGLRRTHWQPATVGLHIRYLRAFWHWLYTEGITAEDLSQAVAAPKQHIREESLLTTAEFARLVAACAGDRWAVRDRAILLMLADTGMRRSEFCAVERDWLTIEDNGDGPESWLMLPGSVTKDRKPRFVLMGVTTTTALIAYLETRTDDHPALWMSERGPLGGDGLWYMLRRRAKLAGIDPSRVHPHLLRKVFASWWIENGGDEQRLMDIGGWNGPEMLRIYVRLGSRQKLQDAHRQFGPVDNLFKGD